MVRPQRPLGLERQATDRISFRRFLGCPEPISDSTTVWLLRERLADDIIRDFIWIGIGIQEKGGITIHGPFGLELPFARIAFGRRDARINMYVEEEQIDEAVRLFQIKDYTAIGEAIKLGLLPFDLDSFRITGIFGAPRPFTNPRIPELDNRRSVESYERMKEILEKDSNINLQNEN